MDNFFKKRPSPNGEKQKNAKRARPAAASADAAHLSPSPRIIVAWNCNSLPSRLRGNDADAIKAFVALHKPDVMFLSEVRAAAANNSANRKPGPHTKWYRSRMRDSDKKSLQDLGLVNSFLSSKELSHYKVYFSLANTKYAGTAMLVNTRTTRAPLAVRYNMEGKDVKGSVHDPDGRVILAKFEDYSILHTYAPNNGWEEDHFKRRRAWDEKVYNYMERVKEDGSRIMWVGDLNVAPLDVDLSHPEHYRKQKGGRYAKKGSTAALHPEDVGQPGCTDRERKRFGEILAAGDLVDAYREMVGDSDNSGLSWRGNIVGIHSGRGMRIDHCIVSRSLFPSIEAVKIMGHNKERIGFLGSDHCPVLIATQEMVDCSANGSKSQKLEGSEAQEVEKLS